MPNNEYTKNLIALNQRILEIAADGDSKKVFFTTPESRTWEKDGFCLEGSLRRLETKDRFAIIAFDGQLTLMFGAKDISIFIKSQYQQGPAWIINYGIA